MLRRDDGHTLIELLGLIGILGVIAGTALPHFDTRREDINTAMQALIGEFRTARTHAITTGTHYSLHFSGDRSLAVQRHEQAEDGTWPVAAKTRDISLPQSVSWWMSPETIEFNTRGVMISASEPVFVYVTDQVGKRVHSISVWPSGQVQAEY
jgi:Tfp pilus assembly protein FimT